jgi:hypothetical protein
MVTSIGVHIVPKGGVSILKLKFVLHQWGKTLVKYVQHALVTRISTTYTFDLWMSKRAHVLFVMIVNFILSNWELEHITSIVPWQL